jgi:hypothetical protein
MPIGVGIGKKDTILQGSFHTMILFLRRIAASAAFGSKFGVTWNFFLVTSEYPS